MIAHFSTNEQVAAGAGTADAKARRVNTVMNFIVIMRRNHFFLMLYSSEMFPGSNGKKGEMGSPIMH